MNEEIFTVNVSDAFLYLQLRKHLREAKFFKLYGETEIVNNTVSILPVDRVTGFEIYPVEGASYRLLNGEELVRSGEVQRSGRVEFFDLPEWKRMLLEVKGNVGPIKVSYLLRR